MSVETKTALDAAIAAHVAETGSGSIVTDWALVAATTTMENIGTGTTAYLLEGNSNQPIHVMAGLFRCGSEKAIWGLDEDEDDD